MINIPDSLKKFFQERLKLDGPMEAIQHKTVPVHKHTIWYYCGGMTLALILIQIVSGILLLLYYRPTIETAYESVRFITAKVHFGWLVRSVHAWAAHLAILSAFLHLASTFFMKAYRPPRELTWVSGVCLLYILMGFGFTGYLLPWSTLSFFATKVGINIAGSAPFVGEWASTFLRGGEDVGDATLSRFYWLHIAVLPASLLAMLGIHLLLIQMQGMSKPLKVKSERSMRFVPDFLLRDLVAWSLVLGLVLSLSVYWPTTLGPKADPYAATPAGILPEWFFLWMFQSLKLFPGRIFGFEGEVVAVITLGIAQVSLFFVPWMDWPSRSGKSHWLPMVLGILVIAYMIVLSLAAIGKLPGL